MVPKLKKLFTANIAKKALQATMAKHAFTPLYAKRLSPAD